MYRSIATPQRQKSIPPKESAHPDCAIYTRFPRGDGQSDTILYLDFEALKLGKLRMIATRMLDLATDTTDWSNIHEPLARKLRMQVGSGQCTSILSSSATFSILLIVRRDAIKEVGELIKDYFAEYNITVGIFP